MILWMYGGCTEAKLVKDPAVYMRVLASATTRTMSTLFPPSGPPLPPFHSLFIQGPYHSSAPAHLLISHVREDLSRKAVFFAPSRQHALGAFQDQWLNANAGNGYVAQCSSRIDVLSVFLLCSSKETMSTNMPRPAILLLAHIWSFL